MGHKYGRKQTQVKGYIENSGHLKHTMLNTLKFRFS
jgi:hypothetical protein